MKIIQVHNYYQQAGGEDAVVAAERAMLEEHGHQIVTYYKSNDLIAASSHKLLAISQLLKASLQTLWNWETYREIRRLLQAERPDLVHCHNTFPLISPSIYWACAKEGVPVVQTLHNYRLLCLNAFLFRQSRHEALGAGRQEEDTSHEGTEVTEGLTQSQEPKAQCPGICEKCVRKHLKWPGVKYGCYRDSRAGSLVVALMLLFHKLIGTWSQKVTAYIALTEFQKQKMIEGYFPAGKIFVKSNFIQIVEDSSHEATKDTKKSETAESLSASGDCVQSEEFGVKSDLNHNHLKLKAGSPYCLFVGRLSPEKGCDVLIRAWALFQEKLVANSYELSGNQKPQLLIVGDGPERKKIERMANSYQLTATVRFLGKQPKERVLSLMCYAKFLVLPSLCYETFGLTVLEAGLQGVAAVISDMTVASEFISDGQSGISFRVGDEEDLAEKMEWAFEHPEKMREMGLAARAVFEEKYTEETNYQRLMEIYRSVTL